MNLLAPSLTRRDIMENAQSEHVGAEYYTLSYQPHEIEPDGKFRHIKVELVNPDTNEPLRMQNQKGKLIKSQIIAKAGYKAPREVE